MQGLQQFIQAEPASWVGSIPVLGTESRGDHVKSEWEFQFTTHGFRFDREYQYRAKIDEKISFGGRQPEFIEPLVRIVPNDREPFPDSDQVGSLHILLPYSPEETRDFAFYLATVVAERTSFTNGDFRIFGGLIFCKKIPETPEEESEIGDSPYAVEMKLVEELGPAKFNSDGLQAAPNHAIKLPLIAQFNEAKRIAQPILRFVGFFKIIESITHVKNETRHLKQVLLGSAELRRMYAALRTDMDFDTFVARAVDARHKCAHLKLDKGFGYTPLDSAIQREVEPLVQILEALSRESIARWGERGD